MNPYLASRFKELYKFFPPEVFKGKR